MISNDALKSCVDSLGIGYLVTDILTFRRELKRNQRSDETGENGTEYGKMSHNFSKFSSHLVKVYMRLVASISNEK